MKLRLVTIITQTSSELTSGTEHVAGDVGAGVLHGAGAALTVGHGVDCHLLQHIGLATPGAQGAPA